MPQESWKEQNNEPILDPLGSLLSEWTDPEAEEEEFRSDFFRGVEGRRKKAAFVLMSIWAVVAFLHLVSWGIWAIIGFSVLLALQTLRLITAKPEAEPEALTEAELSHAPSVSLLVAAKNEEVVIQNLVTQLCSLDYPVNKLDIWIIDDQSTDKTPAILDKLATQYEQLNVIHRSSGASGGKSGALNEVLSLTKGDIIGVFDADALIPQDLLRQVAPLFQQERMGAVQVRKAIANADVNFWTKGQSVEMALDAYFQQQRIVTGGLGELRGNGQFVSRQALNSCGGWNEQTITDDLDLTIRLHLDNWKIGVLVNTPVEEEGVTTAIALWHQRNRWAEGGYQRYLDYWRFIISEPLGFNKKVDLLAFWLMQYILPTAAIPDIVMAIARHHLPMLTPLTGVALSLSGFGMYKGLSRLQTPEKLSMAQFFNYLGQSLRGTLYMVHWLVIMPCVTARMAVRPKRLKWVKTVHAGTMEEELEFERG
jgi:1,2-diacylglycerol 3-beta-glucosyltransferase